MFKGMLTREIKLWKTENREKKSHLVNRVEELENLNLNK